MNIFPAVGADHEDAAVIGVEAEFPAGAVKGVVDLTENRIAPVGDRLAPEQGKQGSAFKHMIGNTAADGIDEGRHQINGFDKAVVNGAAGGIGGRVRIVDDHRNAG